MIDKPKHGEVGKGEYSLGRYCAKCVQYHGIAYLCDSYSQQTKDEIQRILEVVNKRPLVTVPPEEISAISILKESGLT